MKLRPWMVLALVAAAYVGVPQAGYVWDDHALVERNRILEDPHFSDIFGRDPWCCTVAGSTGYYRPLLTVSLLLDRWIFGTDAAGPHLHNLLLHLVVTGLLVSLLRPRTGEARAMVAALLFGLHPVLSETVLWVSARNDLLAAAGVVGALVLLDKKEPVMAAAITFLAALSKENAYLLPIAAFAWRRAWGEKLSFREALALGAALGAALFLRASAELGGMDLDEGDVGVSLSTAVKGTIHFLGLVVAPWPLTSTLSVYIPTPDAWILARCASTFALLFLLVRVGGWRAAWLLAIAALFLAPAAQAVRWYGTFGERYFYLPMVGLVAAIAATAPARLRGLVPVFAVTSLVALFIRVPEWADEETLFTAAVRRAPDGYSWNLLGVEFIRQERWGEATAALDNAIRAGLDAEPFPGASRLYTPTVGARVQRRACRHVIGAAERVPLPDELFLTKARYWADTGCKGLAVFDAGRAMALASRGYWEEAAGVARDAIRADPERRDEIVRAAIDLRDGDLAALGARAMAWPSGAASLLDQVLYLTNAVHGPVAPEAPPQ